MAPIYECRCFFFFQRKRGKRGRLGKESAHVDCRLPSTHERMRARSSTRPDTDASPDDGMGPMPCTQMAHHSPFPGAFLGSCVPTWLSNRPSEAAWLVTLSNRRSEEHTSELQSPDHLACRLLLE